MEWAKVVKSRLPWQTPPLHISKIILQHYLCRLLTIQEIDKLYNNPNTVFYNFTIFYNFFEQKINNEIWIMKTINEIFGMLILRSFNMVACRMAEVAFELPGVYHFSLWTQFPCPKFDGVLHGSAWTTLLQ